MSNRFLSYGNGGSADLAQLQNGSFAINVAEIIDQSLTPGLPVVTNEKQKLISKLISTDELDANLNNFVEIVNEKTVNIPGGHNPFIYTDGPPINQNVNRVYLDDESNLYARSDAGFPKPSALPDYYTGAILVIENEAQLNAYLLSSIDYDILNITADIALTGPKTINKKLKIQSSNGSRITYSTTSTIFTITSPEVWFDGLTFNNINTDNSANILTFTGLTNTKNFVTNCIFETNEFAIASNNNNIQITNNTFIYILVSTPDSHRFIFLTGCQGFVFINDNIFQGNGASTQCININNSIPANFLDGHLIIKNNVSQLLAVQRLLMVDISLAGSNFSLYVSSNNCVTTSGFLLFYGLPLAGIKQIYVYNNVETLAPGISGSKGIIGIDSPVASVIAFDTKIYSADNIVPILRIDYTDLVNPDANQPRVMAYADSKFNPAQPYDVIVPFIKNLSSGGGSEDAVKNPFESDVDAAGFSITNLTNINNINVDDLGTKTQYMSTPLTLPPQTKFLHDVEADSFIKVGGTNQQYLMADGSSLQFSANSGNSNFYLYTNSTALNIDPPDGEVTYNNVNQSDATILYISHRTRDDIDIEVFFKNISQLQDVYIQDQAISENYIRYNITGAPVITVDSKITIPVAVIESLGTGSTSFGNNTRVLLSFFTNNIETDLRLSTLETKTQNITSTNANTNFTKNATFILDGAESVVIRDNSSPFSIAKLIVANTSVQINSVPLFMNNNRIRVIATPVDDGDAANKSYVDNSVNSIPITTLVGISGGISLVANGTGPNLTTKSLVSGTGIFMLANPGLIEIRLADAITNSITSLETKTQNITSTNANTNFTKNATFILDGAESVVIRDNSSPFSIAKLTVANTSVQINSVPLFMNNNRIRVIGTPVDNGDAANKLYVDNAISNIPSTAILPSEYWARQPWTLRTSAADNQWSHVVWSPELRLFAAVSASGTNNRVMTSPNGINWTTRTTNNDSSWRSICWSPEVGLFVAVASFGSANTRVMTSPDGINWTIQLSFTLGWQDVVWSKEVGLFVAVSDSGIGVRIMTSPNGVNWVSRSSPQSNWQSICWSKEVGLFVAVASNGNDRIMTSPDAMIWTAQSSPNTNGWYSVCWSKEVGLFVAVSSTGTNNRVMTSPNGVDWTLRSGAPDYFWRSVIWAKEVGLFVAVSSSAPNNRVMTSPNGINWTAQLTPDTSANQWHSVCWSPELFMFVAVSFIGTGDRVMTSP